MISAGPHRDNVWRKSSTYMTVDHREVVNVTVLEESEHGYVTRQGSRCTRKVAVVGEEGKGKYAEEGKNKALPEAIIYV